MDQITSEINAIKLKLDIIDVMLKKPFKTWTEEEKEEFGDKDQLRGEKRQLRDKKIQLLDRENKLIDERLQLIELEVLKEKKRLLDQGILTSGTSHSSFQRPPFEGTLNLKEPSQQVIYLLEKAVDVSKMPFNAAFLDNCLEYRLDRRTTTYNLDDVDNVKIFLAVSGAGKTRTLLELLYSNFGYYFTAKSSQDDFGSNDLSQCQTYCDRNLDPFKVWDAIKLLYIIRASVCNYLIERGFKEPWQILLAQLHPIAFFGCDIFEYLFKALVRYPRFDFLPNLEYFSFSVIDDIQFCVESKSLYSLPGCRNKRPFFSPLMHVSKLEHTFTQFIVSGSGMELQYFDEAVESCTMQRGLRTFYKHVSKFRALSKEEITSYATQFLQEHNVPEVDSVVSRISSFKLCHGRPQFVASILDGYMKSRDIDVAIGNFVSDISTINGPNFPLRCLKMDLDKNAGTLHRVMSNATLFQAIHDALLNAIWKGKVEIYLPAELDASAIRYGLGFGNTTEGLLRFIESQELAVIECLRYLLPFAYIVLSFAEKILSSPKPQCVGYLMEYLVAFTLVSNYSGVDEANKIRACKDLAHEYLNSNDSTQVCFPDHMCGPDIIYKCAETKTVYIVQVKFLKGMSKQEAANACDTTNPEFFYCKRNSNEVFKGFEDRRSNLLEGLLKLQRDGFSIQQILFVHTGASQEYTRDALVITKESRPEYFNTIGPGVWELLDTVPSNFQ